MELASDYLIRLALSVDDAAALWATAAELAMTAPGMTLGDVVETIGPREDPDIADCLAMLIEPRRFAGCTIRSLACDTASEAATEAAADAPAVPILVPACVSFRVERRTGLSSTLQSLLAAAPAPR